MAGFFKKYQLWLTVGFTAVILIWVSSNLKWGDGRWNSNIKNDASGYYAYLPAVFIYHDLTFSFFRSFTNPEDKDHLFFRKLKEHNGGTVNKYFAGTALAQLPFFAMGHLVSILAGREKDGYSAYYLIFIQVAAIFYALLGQLLLFEILGLYQIKRKIKLLVIFAAVFGTNIYYYVVIEPGMSHVYSFFFAALFTYMVLLFFRKNEVKYFLFAMVALGMIVLIRPVNILIVLGAPFLAGSAHTLSDSIKTMFKKPVALLLGIVLFAGIVFFQLIIYKIQTGDFIVYSYAGEGFDFLHPNIGKFILSYRKGLLVYTPLFWLALPGMFFIYKESRFSFFSLLLFLLIVIYVLSSWWMWYYGGSFGSRAFIEYYVFLFIPLGLALQQAKLKRYLVILTFLLIIVCQVQTFQYQYGYIHYYKMNRELYWKNFLRIDKVIKRAPKDW